jgi:hypothetical protein
MTAAELMIGQHDAFCCSTCCSSVTASQAQLRISPWIFLLYAAVAARLFLFLIFCRLRRLRKQLLYFCSRCLVLLFTSCVRMPEVAAAVRCVLCGQPDGVLKMTDCG